MSKLTLLAIGLSLALIVACILFDVRQASATGEEHHDDD